MTTTVKKTLGSHKKILAVDDERKNIRLLEAKLAPEGYILETALSGQEALDKIKTSTPDLILLDIMMPDMHGLNVLDRIRELAPSTEVIMVTSFDKSAGAAESLTRRASKAS